MRPNIDKHKNQNIMIMLVYKQNITRNVTFAEIFESAR